MKIQYKYTDFLFLLKNISTSVPQCHILQQISHQTVKSDRITMNFTLTQYLPGLHFIRSQPNLIRKSHSLLGMGPILFYTFSFWTYVRIRESKLSGHVKRCPRQVNCFSSSLSLKMKGEITSFHLLFLRAEHPLLYNAFTLLIM